MALDTFRSIGSDMLLSFRKDRNGVSRLLSGLAGIEDNDLDNYRYKLVFTVNGTLQLPQFNGTILIFVLLPFYRRGVKGLIWQWFVLKPFIRWITSPNS